MTFEVAGRPERHVVEALDGYLANIRKDARIVIVQEAREEPIGHEDGMFSTFSEVEMLTKDLETFTWLCLNFSPASIEILDPEEMEVHARDVTNWLNDLLSKLHEVGADYRNQKGAKDHLTVAMNALIKNAILLSCRAAAKTPDEIQQDTGIATEQAMPFLDHLVEKGKLVENGGKYAAKRG